MKLSQMVLIMATICGLYACEEEKKITTNLYQAVPANSVIVAEVNNAATLEKAYLNNSANQILRATPYFKSLESQLSLFTSALSSESLNSFFKERKLLISYMLSGAQKYNALLITTANAKFENDLGNALSAKFTAGSQSYSGAKIFSFAHTSGQTLYVCSQNGLLLISLEKNLIEAGLRQSKSELGLASNADFKKLLKTRNVKDLANVFVNLQELPALAKTHLPEGETQFLKHLGSWAELDLQSTAHEIVGSGLLTYPQNEAFFTRVFQKVRAHESAAAQIIPANFSIWVNYNVGNIGEYQRAYSKYLEQKGELTAYQDLLQKLPPNAPALMEAWVDNEMGIFKAGRSEELSHTFAYLRHRGNAEEATQSLAPFADSTYVEGYRGFVIKKMAAQNTLPRLYGSLFSSLHYPYFTLTENYVIFASNLPALKALLNDILANKTLVNESSYQSFTNQLPGNSHIMVWAANPQFLSLISELAPAFKSTEKALADSLQNLKWAALQIKAADEGAFINGILLHEKPVEEKVSRLWNTQLPHPLKGEPQLLRNHSTKKYDVAIADEKNNLYLLSKEGKVFWNKALDGPIIGDIRQIDIFKNNKLQMVFNTANSLYVVDRLGRDVTGFPVNLPQKATAPVGVFNYDQARNYRLVVPAGPQLLNYNVQGKPVKGWVFKEASSPIISEPQHFTVARQDVIVCLTANGKLYQLNRRGEERFTVDEKIEELKTSFYLREGKSLKTSELIAGSNSGKMYVINPQDKIDALYLDETKPADHLIYFDNRYIFTYDEELIVKDPNQPFTVSLKDDISIKPKALVLNNKFYVGAFSAAAEEIRVFNQQGDLLDGFPIFAQGPFDMGSLEQNGKLNLISYAEDGTLICYLVR